MKERTTEEWLALFRELEIPAAPLNTPDALFDHPHLNAVGPVRDGGHAARSGAVSRCADVVFAYAGPGRRVRPACWGRTPSRCSASWDSTRRRRTCGGIGIGAHVDFEMGQQAADLRARAA